MNSTIQELEAATKDLEADNQKTRSMGCFFFFLLDVNQSKSLGQDIVKEMGEQLSTSEIVSEEIGDIGYWLEAEMFREF